MSCKSYTISVSEATLKVQTPIVWLPMHINLGRASDITLLPVSVFLRVPLTAILFGSVSVASPTQQVCQACHVNLHHL